MPILLPQFKLSHGQMLWAIGDGTAPSPKMKAEARYLRHLGIPQMTADQAKGRGNRNTYSYYQTLETAVGFYVLRQGHKPRKFMEAFVGHRAQNYRLFGRCLAEQPERALEADWVRSRGKIVPMLGHELWLRLHDRTDEEAGSFEVVSARDLKSLRNINILSERFPGNVARPLVPLTRIALPLIVWAREAPETRTGPQ